MSDRFTELLSGKVKPGIYRLVLHDSREHLCANAEVAGWRCYHIDGAQVSDKAAFLRTVAAALRFPAYFGHNWDALEECLRDLSWEHPEKAKGILIIYSDVDRFAKAQPDEWKIAHDILLSAIAAWRKTSPPLVVLLRGANTTAAQTPVL
jgi:hypothetical protein